MRWECRLDASLACEVCGSSPARHCFFSYRERGEEIPTGYDLDMCPRCMHDTDSFPRDLTLFLLAQLRDAALRWERRHFVQSWRPGSLIVSSGSPNIDP